MTGQTNNLQQETSKAGRPAEKAADVQPVKKKKKIGLIIAIALAAALIVGVAVIAGSIALHRTDPLTRLEKAAVKTVREVSSIREYKDVRDVLEDGSVKAKIDLMHAGALTKQLFGVTVNLNGSAETKVWFSLDEDPAIAVRAEGKIKDTTILDATAVADRDHLGIESESLLGVPYGVDLRTAADLLEKSVFNPDNHSEYALGQKIYDALEAVFKSSVYGKTADLKKDAARFSEELVKETDRLLRKHAVITEEDASVKIGSKNVGGKQITVMLAGNDLKRFEAELFAFLCENKSLETILDKTGFKMTVHKDGEPVQIDTAAVKEFLKLCKQNAEDGDYSKKRSIVYGFVDNLQRLVKISWETENKAGNGKVTLAVGPDPGDPDYALLDLVLALDQGKRFSVTAEATVTESLSGVKNTEITFGTSVTAVPKIKASIRKNKLTGSMTLGLSVGEAALSMEGKLTNVLGGWVVQCKKFGMNFKENRLEINADVLSLEIRKRDAFPELSDYREILTLTEKDVKAVFQEAGDALKNLYKKVLKALL